MSPRRTKPQADNLAAFLSGYDRCFYPSLSCHHAPSRRRCPCLPAEKASPTSYRPTTAIYRCGSLRTAACRRCAYPSHASMHAPFPFMHTLIPPWLSAHGGVPQYVPRSRGATDARRLRAAVHGAQWPHGAPCVARRAPSGMARALGRGSGLKEECERRGDTYVERDAHGYRGGCGAVPGTEGLRTFGAAACGQNGGAASV